MLSFKGFKAKDLCDSHLSPTRRTFLRVGGCGMLGLSLPSLLQLQAASGAESITGDALSGGGPGWGKAKSIIHGLLARRPQSPGPVGSQRERAGQRQERVQSDQYEDSWHQVHRELAQTEPDQRSVHDDSVDVLHAQRVCSITPRRSTR